jgi:ubiquinone/menaquinone biosynthesis C-methylase UbiE
VRESRAVSQDELRRTLYETWETMAPGWDQRRDWAWNLTRSVAEDLVERLNPRPGETILELAAGPGDTGYLAAERLGLEGRLISTDFSPSMVDTARRRAAERGIANAEFRVMDAERLELPDDTVDGVLCRWGYMLMPDPAAALAETRRVLRSGGRLAFSVWAGPEHNAWVALPARLLVERGHMPTPQPGAPGIFALASREQIDELLRGAGFERWDVEEVGMSWRYSDFEDYWSYLVEFVGAVGMAIRALPRDEQESVRAALAEAVDPMRVDGRYEFAGLCLNVLAT